MLRIVVYGGLDTESRIALERARLASILLSSNYSIPSTTEEVILPVGSDESRYQGLPEVWVEEGEERHPIAMGRPPTTSEVLEAAFRLLENIYGSPFTPLKPLGDDEAEEGLLGV
ncbi:MAG: hypothetical protein LRS46_01520 [Desulfurococcales archaeon]|nr:hypothetical protein [Desulfurococcales archaeon]